MSYVRFIPGELVVGNDHTGNDPSIKGKIFEVLYFDDREEPRHHWIRVRDVNTGKALSCFAKRFSKIEGPW